MNSSVIIWAVWLLSEIALTLFLRSGSNDRKGLDKSSMALIWIIVGIAVTIGVLSAIFIRLPISDSSLVIYSGLIIMILGLLIRWIAIWALGRFFTTDVTIRSDHQLMKSGLYKYVRHPSYTGILLTFAGFGLSLNNWVSLALICILVTGAIIYRIIIEEKALLEAFGAEYEQYMKMSWRLFPWIY
jgi:protein-S-isoprenylcysteine O-methyltransferase Ste14